MAGTGEGKKEEADYKRLHSFPLIRVRARRDGPPGDPEHRSSSSFQRCSDQILDLHSDLFHSAKCWSKTLVSPCWRMWFKAGFFKLAAVVEGTDGSAGNYVIAFKI